MMSNIDRHFGSATLRAGLLCAMGIAGAVGVCGLAGCRGDREDAPPRQFFPDLDDQLKWKPQTKSEFFADGRTMRKPVAGTVAFGATSFAPRAGDEWTAPYAKQREQLVRDDPAVYEGHDKDGKLIQTIPVPVTMDFLQLGQAKFNIFCAVCHGYYGDGQGQVAQQWATPVANFHDSKYKKADPALPASEKYFDGHLFRTAMLGYFDETGAQKMPGYSHAISAEEGWAIVAYIRALQTSREGTLTEVPDSQRAVVAKALAEAKAQAVAEEARKAAAEAARKAAAPPGAPPAIPAPAPAPTPNAGGVK